ncbi:hypothetical protein B0H11DRAFT_2325845 [Mycena galericulata]|nr:hypothetical protein B0H11DRAFT_2325845 [Mycena galericulata]
MAARMGLRSEKEKGVKLPLGPQGLVMQLGAVPGVGERGKRGGRKQARASPRRRPAGEAIYHLHWQVDSIAPRRWKGAAGVGPSAGSRKAGGGQNGRGEGRAMRLGLRFEEENGRAGAVPGRVQGLVKRLGAVPGAGSAGGAQTSRGEPKEASSGGRRYTIFIGRWIPSSRSAGKELEERGRALEAERQGEAKTGAERERWVGQVKRPGERGQRRVLKPSRSSREGKRGWSGWAMPVLIPALANALWTQGPRTKVPKKVVGGSTATRRRPELQMSGQRRRLISKRARRMPTEKGPDISHPSFPSEARDVSIPQIRLSMFEQFFAPWADSPSNLLPNLRSLTIRFHSRSQIPDSSWEALLRALTARRTKIRTIRIDLFSTTSKPAAYILAAFEELVVDGMEVYIGTKKQNFCTV